MGKLSELQTKVTGKAVNVAPLQPSSFSSTSKFSDTVRKTLPTVSKSSAVNHAGRAADVSAGKAGQVSGLPTLGDENNNSSNWLTKATDALSGADQKLGELLTTPAKSGFFDGVSVLGDGTLKGFGRDFAYGSERAGAALLGVGENITDFIGSGFYKGLQGITSLGGKAKNPVSEWAGQQADAFLDNSITRDYEQSIRERYNPAKGAENLTGVGQTVVQMLPAIATGNIAAKAISSGVNAINAPLAADIGSKVSQAVFGLQSAGAGANEAKQEGATTGQALAYGAASGLLETSIENIAGGIPGMGQGKIREIADALKASPIVEKALDIAGEGGEEALSTIISPYLKRAIYDPDAANATGKEIAESAIMGAVAAGVLQAGIELPGAVSNVKSQVEQAQAQIGSNTDIMDRVNQRLNTPGQVQSDFVTLPTAGKQYNNVTLLPVQEQQQAQNKAASTGEAESGLIPITEENAASLSSGKNNIIARKASDIISFVQNALRKKGGPERLYMGTIPDTAASAIMDATGMDVAGYTAILPGDSVQHIFKNHGSVMTEESRGQKAVTAEDVALIPQVISAPDSVSLSSDTDALGRPVLLISKQIGDTYVTAQAVTDGRHALTTNSLWIKKGKGPAPIPDTGTKTGPVDNARSALMSSSSITPIIADSSAGVKNQSAQEGGAVYGDRGGSVGAAAPKFPYIDTPTQSVANGLFTEQEKTDSPALGGTTHGRYTNEASRTDAEQRLSYDYEGEKASLESSDEWGAAETVMGYQILSDLVNEARKTGDYSEVVRWKKVFDQKGTVEGQALQARKQFSSTPEMIVSEAAEILNGPNVRKLKPGQKESIMRDVNAQSEAYKNIESGDIDGLLSLIRRNNEIRRTTGFFSKSTSKQMDFALKWVARQDGGEQFLRDVATSQIRGISQDYVNVGILEKIKAIRYQNMLSKISTVARNIVANNFLDPTESVSNDAAIWLDILLSKKTGQRTTTIDPSWFSSAKKKGAVEGMLKSFIQVGLDADVDNATGKYEGPSGRTFKMTGNPLERLLSTMQKYNQYALTTTDEFQKGGIQAETQREIQKLQDKGLLMPGALSEWAQETAKQRTLQSDGKLSQTMVGVRNSLNKFSIHDKKGGSIGAGDILLPFAKVPANAVSMVYSYTPLGMINGIKHVAEVLHSANVDAKTSKAGGNAKTFSPEKQAQAVREIGRSVTGTTLIGVFAGLAAKGVISVAGADDEDKERLESAEGKTGTQLNLSALERMISGESTEWEQGDTLMSIGFLDPLNGLMTAGSLIADDLEENGKLSAKGLATASISGVVEALLELPAMSQINDLINSFRYSDEETIGGKTADAASGFAASQVSSFLLPNALRGIATGMDNTVRNAYRGSTLENARDNFVSGVPMVREKLPASIDNFGRDKTYTGNSVLNFMNANFLPGQITKYKQDAVGAELEYLYDSTGAVTVYPNRKAPNYVTINKEKINLTADQKDKYQRTYGQTAYGLIQNAMRSDLYTNLSDEDKVKFLSKIYEYSGAVAKDEQFGEGMSDWMVEARDSNNVLGAISDRVLYGGGQGSSSETIAKTKTAVEEIGLTVEQYQAMRSGMDADGNDSVSQKEAKAYLDSQNFTREQKAQLWTLINKAWKNNPYD